VSGGKPNATETNPGPGRREAPGPFLRPRSLLPRTAEGWLYLAVALVQLAPIWAVPIFVTTDGPAHAFTAWALLHHGDPEFPQLSDHFVLALRPVPNWTAQFLLSLLLPLCSSFTAEKLLASACVLLWAAGARWAVRAVDERAAWVALLALPLTFNYAFKAGFFNFALGLGCFLLVLGCAWRWRRRLGWGAAVALNGLLLLTYFSHLVPHVMALVAVAGIWLATPHLQGWRGRLAALAALAPQAVLPVWFVLSQNAPVQAAKGSWQVALRYLVRLQVLSPPSLARATAAAFGALALAALYLLARRRRSTAGYPRAELHAFPILALLFTIVYLAAPEGAAGGGILRPRLSLFPYLVLLPWLTLAHGRRHRFAAAALAVLALAGSTLALRAQLDLRPAAAEVHAALAPIAPHSRLLPLFFEAGRKAAASRHQPDHAAIAKDLVNWGFYQGRHDYFPVHFRPGLPGLDVYAIETTPGELPIGRYRNRVDYILTWRLPAGSAAERRILRFYRPVSGVGRAALFERRGRGPRAAEGAPPALPTVP
jgi:hypothetical protein